MRENDDKPGRGVGWLAFALALGAAAAYLLVWHLLPGDDGCGPPVTQLPAASWRLLRSSSLSRLPASFSHFGSKRWRVGTLAWGAVTIMVIGGMLEVFIVLYEIAVHQCTQSMPDYAF